MVIFKFFFFRKYLYVFIKVVRVDVYRSLLNNKLIVIVDCYNKDNEIIYS